MTISLAKTVVPTNVNKIGVKKATANRGKNAHVAVVGRKDLYS